MDVIRVQNWTNEQVLLWYRGLDESLQKYELHFRNAGVNGGQLLNLSYDDLYLLYIDQIGHQELILDAVSLLQQLDYGLESETLQSRALCLKCRCRGLRSSINARRKEAEDYGYEGGVSLQSGATNQLLRFASDILNEAKQLILWLDRPPFSSKQTFRATRDKLIELCYELSVTMQQSVFACVIEDAALNICNELENNADGIVQSADSLTLQPVSLEHIHLRDINPAEGLGLFIKATFEGHHVVTGTKSGSVAARVRRITSGDEVIAVNGKAVVGWSLVSLVAALKEHTYEVTLLIKKRPQLSRSSSSSNLLTSLHRTENERSKIFRVATPIKRIQNPSQPIRQLPTTNISEAVADSRPSSSTWSSQRSHEQMIELPSERISHTSGSDASGKLVLTKDSELSLTKLAIPARNEKTQKFNEPPHISVDITSPMDVFKFPPPPAEPYTPKTDSLTVHKAIANQTSSRTASPNSLLDIENKRRYTVIGGSTVDQQWYENFLARVGSSKFSSSSGHPSREKLSSNEEVFAECNSSKNLPSSSLYLNDCNNILQNKRQTKSARPVSMPPNYYIPSPAYSNQLALQSGNHSNYHHYVSAYRKTAPRKNYISVNDWDPPPVRYYRDFNVNNNNNANSPAYTTPGRNPPKPPPRSSSITKLSNRLSDEVRQKIEHPRQSSLPEKSFLAVDRGKEHQSGAAKPAIARKPTGSYQPKKSKLGKSSRSRSTPHLQQQHAENKRVTTILSSSEDKLKEISSTRKISSRKDQRLLSESSQLTLQNTSSPDSSSSRPVPKPRTYAQKHTAEKQSIGGISSSHDNLLDAYTQNLNRDRQTTWVQSDMLVRNHTSTPLHRPLTPTRSSPTRISYLVAIKNENLHSRINSNENLDENDVNDDNYDIRVIAGVPVRLRKSLNRIAGSRLKLSRPSTDKGKSNHLHEMKSEKRVSCRDLGQGDCQGWLWKKKSEVGLVSSVQLSSKWSKRWVVLKNRALYCYREKSLESDQRAECYISLPGYTVAPAAEGKKKFAFRISHVKRKTFFFAAEKQLDMSKWMNKLGLAAIEYNYEDEQSNSSATKENDYYSESDEDDSSNPVSSDINTTPNGSSSSLVKNDAENNENAILPATNRIETTRLLYPLDNYSENVNSQSKFDSDKLEDCINTDLTQSIFSSANNVNFLDEGHTLTDCNSSKDNLFGSALDQPNGLSSILVKEKTNSSIGEKNQDLKKVSNSLIQLETDSSSSSQATSTSKDQVSLPQNYQARSSPRQIQPSVSDPTLNKLQSTNNSTNNEPEPFILRPLARSEPPDILHNLRQSIKKAEIDILGNNRRITLRRKMTILAQDPQLNERKLRKRALERELKAKELELAYFEKLLNKEKISSLDLHTWINQHPSLFAEIGTLRRISKNKRSLGNRNLIETCLQDSSDSSRHSDSSSASAIDLSKLDGTGSIQRPIGKNNNNNNNSQFDSSDSQPPPSALNPPDFSRSEDPTHQTHREHNASSTFLVDDVRRRKVHPYRRFPKESSSDKQYLETDL